MLIDQLPEITDANNADEMPIEQGTTTRKIKILNLLKNVLKLTGGILTGQLTIADNSLVVQDSRITTGTAPLSNIYGRSVYLNDSTGFNIATLQIMSLANGREGFQLVAGKKVNGVNKHNYLRMNVDANGDPVVELNGAAAWLAALGLGSVSTGASGANLFTVASGFTLAEATSYRWGKVGVINISITKTTAVTTPTFLTLGTLTASSGMKPITVVPAESTDNAIDNAYVLISGQINCNVTTWAAGTSKRIMAVYLLA